MFVCFFKFYRNVLDFRKLFDFIKEDISFIFNIFFDYDENKYRRRLVMEWLIKWLK